MRVLSRKRFPEIVRASEVQCSLKFRVRIAQRAGVVEMSGGVQPSLEGSLLPLSELRASAQSNLLNLIDRRPGRKVLVLDPKISGPLALVANIGMLKEHGIEKLYHLEKNLSVADGECVCEREREPSSLPARAQSHVIPRFQKKLPDPWPSSPDS